MHVISSENGNSATRKQHLQNKEIKLSGLIQTRCTLIAICLGKLRKWKMYMGKSAAIHRQLSPNRNHNLTLNPKP